MTEVALTGRLLVATPLLVDPNFDRTVVLVLDHDGDGTLGVVVNRPTAVPVREVLPAWTELAEPLPMVFQGGPVALDSALGLAELRSVPRPGRASRWAGGGCTATSAWWTWTSRRRCWPRRSRPSGSTPGTRAGARAAGAGAGSGRVVRGGPGPGDAFTLDPDRTWRTVLRRQRGELALLSTFPRIRR